ncbi:MAG TPA: MFS transporter [Chloroflexia bacterium]|nr:MFS transporter [Chloroflexia bacterium]
MAKNIITDKALEEKTLHTTETTPPTPHRDKLLVSRGSIVANILSTLLLRIAGRCSFVLLGFYLGEHFASASIVAVVIESYYITELLFAPIIGGLSDRKGRKPFLLFAPVLGALATGFLLLASMLFPHPNGDQFNWQIVILLLMVLAGRLLEGLSTGFNAPASLGYITDATVGSEKLRARVVTAFEVATVFGLAMAIPLGGTISKWIGTWGFLVVMAMHGLNFLLIMFFMGESVKPSENSEGSHGSLLSSFQVITEKRIFTFLPAWLTVNALVGALTNLTTIVLAYPNPAADQRFPHQLLYGGFHKDTATYIVGGFGAFFLIGMGLWVIVLPRMRRSTAMFIGLAGLAIVIVCLWLVNGLAENPTEISNSVKPELYTLLPLIVAGIVMLSGFTPAALTQMGAISETLPGKRGAVMGLYSVALGVGQFVGIFVGGIAVDMGGFYGLMIFSAILGLISFFSVLYMRSHNHDMLKTGAHSA